MINVTTHLNTYSCVSIYINNMVFIIFRLHFPVHPVRRLRLLLQPGRTRRRWRWWRVKRWDDDGILDVFVFFWWLLVETGRWEWTKMHDQPKRFRDNISEKAELLKGVFLVQQTQRWIHRAPTYDNNRTRIQVHLINSTASSSFSAIRRRRTFEAELRFKKFS